MNYVLTGKWFCLIVMTVAVSFQVMAVDGVWTNTAGGEWSWSDSSNWYNDIVAGGVESTAYMTNTPSAPRIVTLPPEGVTLGNLVYNHQGTYHQVRFRGGPLVFSAELPEILSENIYTIFYNDLQGTNGLVFHGGVVGTDTSYTGPTTLAEDWIYDYMHLGALSQSSSISNYMSTGPLIFEGGSLGVSGRANSSATSSDWILTAGDTIVRKVAVSLTASPGATVTGNGIQEGTFVKYNIDQDTFELSQAATVSGTNTLSFGAVNGSYSYQSFEKIQMDANGTLQVDNNGGTLTRVDAGDLAGGNVILSKTGYGTFAVSGGNTFGGTLSLGGGTFEINDKEGVQPALSNLYMSSSTYFSVPDSGTTATVNRISGSAELIKNGSGCVVLESVEDNGLQLTVSEGVLTIIPPEIPETVPVDGAWLHVDASDLSSMTLVNENGTNFVTQWNDTRTNGIYAASPGGAPRPFLRDDFQNGLPVVDFGSFRYPADPFNVYGYGGYLSLNQTCSTLREAFLVFSDTPDCTNLPANLNWSFLLGSASTYHFHRGLYGALFYHGLASANLSNGIEMIDDTEASDSTLMPSGFHVVSLSTVGPVTASQFARDRTISSGGQRLAEVLIYTNVLSETERSDIRAYLMNKWLDQVPERPVVSMLKLEGDGEFRVDEGETLHVGVLELGGDILKTGGGILSAEEIHETGGSLTVEDGSVMLINDSGVSSRLSGITYANNAYIAVDKEAAALNVGWIDAHADLIKSGGGTLTVGILGSDINSLVVEEGVLSVSGDDNSAWFHTDASDLSSMTMVNENGTNFVTQWKDTLTNGIYASEITGAPRPFLRDDFQNGRPVVDFGSYRYPASPFYIYGHGGCLSWNQACSTLREAFLVFSDTPDCADLPSNLNWSFLLGSATTFQFHRGFYGALFLNSYSSEYLRNGEITVDGTNVAYSSLLPSGFQVIGLSTTGPVTASQFARDRSISGGGQRLAEVIIYTDELTQPVKQGVIKHLLGKWKNVARSFSEIKAASGSTLSIEDGVIHTESLSGAGTVSVDRIAASAVSAGDSAGETGTLSFSGDLELNDGAIVSVDCAPPLCDCVTVNGTLRILGDGTFAVNCLTSGFYGQDITVFTFSSVEGTENLSQWSVTGEILDCYSVKPLIDGNTLVLRISDKGLLIMIR